MASVFMCYNLFSLLVCLIVCLLLLFSSEFTAPDRSSSIFCKVYFAEEFHRLRETVFPSGEDK